MSNEITVKISCSLQEMYDALKNKGFVICDKFNLEDIYYIPNDINIKEQPIREILSKYILIRNITQFETTDFKNSYNTTNITYKSKKIASNGDIINQEKTECQIYDKEQGKKFLKRLKYKEIMTIREKTIVYKKDGLELAIKDVENGDNLIEMETIENNPMLDTTEKLKIIINELQIPIETNDYFVKKAENELKRILLGE